MASIECASSDPGFLCLSMEQVIVSANRDYILIPHKALLESSLTLRRQSKHKGRRASRHTVNLESSNQVLRRPCLKHISEQDFNRHDSRLSLDVKATTQMTFNMPPSPPRTPTSSSVYSRSIMYTPSAPQKSNGRTLPEFPRYGQPTTKYPRRPRVLNDRYLPGHYKQGCSTITSEQWNKARTKDLSLNVSTGVFTKGSNPSEDPPQKSTREVQIDAVAAGLNDAHFLMPCVRNSLRHELTCGHTICTIEPEVCAKTCKGSHDPGQVKDCDTPFECMQCIANHVQELQHGRLTMFAAELADRAKEMGKSSDWVHDKIGFMEMAWRDEDLEEIRSLLEMGKGRYCQSLWIEPEIQDLVDTANKARSIHTKSSQEQYASPTWMHRSTPEPSTPRNRMSIEDRTYSPRSSISSITTTDSRLPSFQRSVTNLFARREKKDPQPARPSSAVGTDSSSPKFTPSDADDEPEAEEVTMRTRDDNESPIHDVPPKLRPQTGRIQVREAG